MVVILGKRIGFDSLTKFGEECSVVFHVQKLCKLKLELGTQNICFPDTTNFQMH